jgi:enamine deaminase RidA (YjgF/YER057c/UK114 family)
VIKSFRASLPPRTIKTNASSTFLRRFTGPEAHELSALCQPACATVDVARQAEAVYRAILRLLDAEGTSFEALATETVFLRDIREDLAVVLDTRARVLGEAGLEPCRPLTTLIEQPPLDGGGRLGVSLLALIPRHRRPLSVRDVRGDSACGCEACARSGARLVDLVDQTCFFAGNVHGPGGNAFDEAYGMFRAAEELLRKGGMTFRNVVRTWIYLRDIDRDYEALNQARREFFRQRGITLRPASTGIGGGPSAVRHALAMSLYAVTSARPLEMEIMSAPTLNEPWMYGSDFSRGLRVVDANKIALYVSGTASVDEAGRTVHVGDFEAQVTRMLTNISALLAAQGASFRDVVSAVTYVRPPGDASRLRAMFHDQGFDGFPNALVEARICRSDLLCEAEAIAVLPLPQRA